MRRAVLAALLLAACTKHSASRDGGIARVALDARAPQPGNGCLRASDCRILVDMCGDVSAVPVPDVMAALAEQRVSNGGRDCKRPGPMSPMRADCIAGACAVAEIPPAQVIHCPGDHGDGGVACPADTSCIDGACFGGFAWDCAVDDDCRLYRAVCGIAAASTLDAKQQANEAVHTGGTAYCLDEGKIGKPLERIGAACREGTCVVGSDPADMPCPQKGDDCPAGRTCIERLCVAGWVDPDPPAPPPPPDAGPAPRPTAGSRRSGRSSR